MLLICIKLIKLSKKRYFPYLKVNFLKLNLMEEAVSPCSNYEQKISYSSMCTRRMSYD